MNENIKKDPNFEPKDLFPDVQNIYEHYKSLWHSTLFKELMNYSVCSM
jgi:hypothetical protein